MSMRLTCRHHLTAHIIISIRKALSQKEVQRNGYLLFVQLRSTGSEGKSSSTAGILRASLITCDDPLHSLAHSLWTGLRQ